MTTTTQIISFYVPRMRAHWTEQQISDAIWRHTIGIVDRVDFGDFVPLNQTNIRSAFIHMSWMEVWGEAWIEKEIAANGHCKFQVTYDEYWMLLPNKNPIPRTHLNVHQLAEITRKQDERIAELEALVAQLTERLETPAPTPRTEPPRLVRTISMASDSLDDFRTNLNQDYLQEALDSFREQEMERLYRSWQEAEEGEEDEYTDMPALISCSESDSEDEGSTGSDRMKISEELCGNN
jgi:hypothetical protein